MMPAGKTCYYDVLGVAPKAPIQEIKSAYKKLVLQYHPDKNKDPEAKPKFLQIQEAWDVLSDVNERTWYDNNRESVLYNKDELREEDYDMLAFGFNIWKYFSVNCFTGFQDNEGGFFNVYRTAFELIKAEEQRAYERGQEQEYDFRKLCGFGSKNTGEDEVIRFYRQWESFNSYKSFKWVDQYNLKQAPNRQVRRLMEKQNKKQRAKQKKKYIKNVRDLIAFVKRRDPRWKEIEEKAKQVEERKREEAKQEIERLKLQKQKNKHIKAQLEQQRIRQAEEYFRQKELQERQLLRQEQVQYEQEQFYCKICNKKFKSNGQLSNHEQSKAHRNQYNKIKRQLMTPEQLKEQQRKPQNSDKKQQQKKDSKKDKKRNKKRQEKKLDWPSDDEDINQKYKQKQKQKQKKQRQSKPDKIIRSAKQESDDSSSDMERMMNFGGHAEQSSGEEIPKRGKKKQRSISRKSEDDWQQEQKKDKKKKNTKKQSKQEQQQKEQEVKVQKKKREKGSTNKDGIFCLKCKQEFQTKTKLFKHLDATGHAALKR